MEIKESSKISLKVLIALGGLLLPASIAFSSYLNNKIETKVTPIIEVVIDMKQDLRDIKLLLIKQYGRNK